MALGGAALLATGCAGHFDCDTLVVSEATNTIATLSFTTPKDATTHIEYGLIGGDLLTTPVTTEPDTEHSHVMLGLAAGLGNWYRAVADYGRAEPTTCEGVYEADPAPSAVPDYLATVHQRDKLASRYMLISNAGEEDAGPTVLDRDGNIVWYMLKDDLIAHTQMEASIGGIGGQNTAVGPSLAYLEQDVLREDATLSVLKGMTWTQEETVSHPAEGAHHSFVQLPDLTVAYLGTDVREWTDTETGEIVEVAGDTIVEVTPDGTDAIIWSTWDELEVEKHAKWDVPYFPKHKDWTHANSLFYDIEQDRYLVSLGNLNMVVEVSRETGLITDTFGEDGETVFIDDSTEFQFQHGVRWTDDRTMLMTTTNRYTFAVEYDVDLDANTMEEVWSYGYDAHIYAAALGEIYPLPNGNRFISFGMGGRLEEVDENNELVWSMEANTGLDRLTSPRFFDDFYSDEWLLQNR